ncbi:FtsX-like permease family protein, partial [candidate division KSB1 bacterium]|nr:FtsX-like permease family protein [candidate division KSB1 bacterium]
RNIPRTSSLRFEFLVSFDAAHALYSLKDDWKQNKLGTLVLLRDGVTKKQFDEKLETFIQKYVADTPESPKKMYLFSLLDFRLNSEHITSFFSSSNRISVMIVLALGIILLLVVSINFINLSIARYMQRIREIGVRKAIGARKYQLITQFISESLILSFIALPVAVLLYELVEPIFTAYLGNFSGALHVSDVPNSIWNYPFLLKYLVGTALLVGLFSGIYPAFYLSTFKPTTILKGSVQTGIKKRRGSKVLIVIQFTLSIILIAAASLVKDQLEALVNAEFGYHKEGVAFVNLPEASRVKYDAFKTEISHHPEIITTSAAAGMPLIWTSNQNVWQPGQTEADAKTINTYGVDYNFTEALGIEIQSGRSFARAHDDDNGFILNESAVKRLNLEDPLGKQLIFNGRTGTVIGTVKDFIFDDIGFEMPPALLFIAPENFNYLVVKYAIPNHTREIEQFIKEKWQAFFPNLPYEFTALDYRFRDFLDIFDRISNFFNIVGLMAVLFSCLGLLGLVTYLVERRTKEIGIRKVLGASWMHISWTYVREFILLVFIANFVGLGLLSFGWKKVLQTGLLYMTDISTGTYLFVVFISFLTALIAVGSQTVKAALANPVDSLRYE